jgi:hypothetical protein
MVSGGNLSDSVRQEIFKPTKLGFGQLIGWTFFGLCLAACADAVSHQLPPAGLGVLAYFGLGIFVFRTWLSRCTYRLILKRDSFQHIYWRALWNFLWRNACIGIPFAFIVGFIAGEGGQEAGIAIGFILGSWFFLWLFVWDVPIWCCKNVKRLAQPVPPKLAVPRPVAQPIAAQ